MITKCSLRFRVLSCLLFWTLPAMAQSISYSALYDNTTFPRSIDLSRPVGATEGTAGTSPMGAVNYTIPIKCPPGTNGVMPQISVVYNSQSGNGQLGQGWALTGLSAITRVGWDYYHKAKAAPITYTNTDLFTLDGIYLSARSGSYGASGTTYATESETYSVTTSTGNIGGGPQYFSVTAKDGTVTQYGYTTDSRVMSDDGTKVMTWRVNKIQDVNGNFISFTYDNSDQDSRISKISYTGNTNTGLIPYNEINFYYGIRSDFNVFYDGGYTLQSKYLLNQIEVKGEGDVFKLYQFNYGKNNEISYLKNIQEFDHAGGTSLNDTRFLYGLTTSGDFAETLSAGVLSSSPYANESVGDFDGDGISDFMICVQTNSNDQNWSADVKLKKRSATSSTYTTTASLTFDATTVIENNRSQRDYSPVASDFNGDGRDDIILSHSTFSGATETSSGGRTLDWVKVYYCNTSGGIEALPDYTYTPPGIYTSIHKGINNKQNYLYTGDFDGDGRADFITILRGELFFNSPATGVKDKTGILPSGYTVSGLFDDADGVYVVNMDGDAKSDLMIIQGGTTRVFTFNFNAVLYDLHIDQIGINMSYPTSSNQILLGDFNGDGKTDILAGPLVTAPTTANWQIAYSTGIGFATSIFTFDHPIYYENPITGPYLVTDQLCIGDFNGDGRSDIYNFYRTVGGGTLKHNVYYSTGKGFLQKTQTTTRNGMVNLIAGDFNGDGRADISCNQMDLSLLSFNPFDQSHLLSKVTDGLNRTGEFVYGPLTYGATGTGNFYVKGTGETYPVNNTQFPVYVVTSSKVPDGIGGTNTTWYGYENFRIHRAGRGTLGFEKVKSYDVNADMRSESIYDLNRTYFNTSLKTIKTFLNSTGFQLSQVDNNVVTYQNLSGGGFVQNDLGSTSQDFILGTTTQTVNTYDGFITMGGYSGNGNVINTTTTVTGGPETLTSATVATYIAAISGVSIPNKPSTVTTTKQRGSKPSVAFKSTMTYNTKGQLLSQISQPDPAPTLVNTVVENFQYDPGYGTITQKETRTPIGVIAASLWPKTLYEYDPYRRFVTHETNPLGDANTIVTHKFWGKPTSVTDVNGLVTTYTYDNFGKLISSSVPTSLTASYSVSYSCNWNVSGNQRFYTLIQHPAAPDEKTTFDLLGRAVIKEKEGFSGWTKSLISYDVRGNILTATNDYYTTETPVTTTNTYDGFNRLSSAANVFGTTTYAYVGGSGLLKTTVTLPDGKIKSTTTDAAGKIVKSSNGTAGVMRYEYDSYGNKISTSLGTEALAYQSMITKEYNNAGRITKMTDADAGTTTYEYNAFGQLTKQTDPLGKQTLLQYDVAGRLVNKSLDGYSTTWEYYDKTKGYALKKAKVVLPSGIFSVEDNYEYTEGGNVSKHNRLALGHIMEKNFSYDTYGRLLTTDYTPSGFRTRQQYNANSYLQKITTNFYGGGASDKVLYQATAMNGNGQITSYKRVDGLPSSINYYNGVVTGFITPGVQSLNTSTDYSNGNLMSRTDLNAGTQEDFNYDALDRLTHAQAQKLAGPSGPGIMHTPMDMTYDNNFWGSFGRIMQKSDVGTYTYTGSPRNAVKSITDPSGIISHETQQIVYTPFFKTASITENVGGVACEQTYTYNADEARVYGQLKRGGAIATSRWYMDDYEINTNAGGPENHIHYIGGDAGICTIVVQNAGTGAFSYYGAYTDHLGSLVAITDGVSGSIVTRQSFDPWGKERSADTWGALTPGIKPDWLYRGYTGHEMLPDFNLVNMNGRMYDPVNGRMLRPDNYVQNGLNSQGYNRYSYCWNNPLKYTDPSGDLVFVVPGISFNSSGALNVNLTVGVGIPMISSAQITFGHDFGNNNTYFGLGGTYAGVTVTGTWGTKSGFGAGAGMGYGAGVPGVSTSLGSIGVGWSQNGGWYASAAGFNLNAQGLNYAPSLSFSYAMMYRSKRFTDFGDFDEDDVNKCLTLKEVIVHAPTHVNGGWLMDQNYGWANVGRVQQAGTDVDGKDLIGPGLIAVGARIIALKPVAALGSQRGSSIASTVLSKSLPIKMPFRIAGTTNLGRMLGRTLPFTAVGVGMTSLSIEDFFRDISPTFDMIIGARDFKMGMD